MNVQTGDVYLAYSTLNYEIQTTYTYTYQVCDSGVPQLCSEVRNLRIDINDINDNRPIFQTANREISLPEDTIPSLIFTLIASDTDSGVNGVFRFEMISNDPLFEIDSISGGVYLIRTFDFEDERQHVLIIRVYDLGSPRLASITNFTVSVQDINDNSPIFSPASYAPYILENRPTGAFVVQLFATDRDHLENMELEFSLIDDLDDPGKFTLSPFSPTSVILNVTSSFPPLDRETQDTYTLYVVATDNAEAVYTSAQNNASAQVGIPFILDIVIMLGTYLWTKLSL